MQYIRDNYRENGMTDEQALAKYLAERDIKYSSDSESPRYHNKAKYENGQWIYPDDNANQCNYKVLIGDGRHGEFIIDDQGNFVSELDTENRTENDVINGSSFNYADFQQDKADEDDGTAKQKDYISSHNKLDVNTPKVWDPQFREEQADNYISPNKANEGEKNWEDSFKNSEGNYAKDGKSVKERTDEAAKTFNEMVDSYEE
ncbi:DUF3114 domain-containing protein [Streptococcus dentasini]